MHDGASATERLARRIQAIASGPIPADAIDTAKACLLYGVTMACAGTGVNDPVRRALRASGRAGTASIVASAEKARPEDAAAVNAALFAARGQNDTHAALSGHVGCLVLPAVLAVAEAHGGSGERLLSAIVAGYDVGIALAHGIADETRRRGLRNTSLFGPAAVAAAVSVLLGLGIAESADALAFGLDAGSGLLQCWGEGTVEWRWQAARSASAGVTAEMLAAAGAKAARFVYEGPQGFAMAHAGTIPALPSEEPNWSIRDTEFKPFPGCYVVQGLCQALVEWRVEHRLSPIDLATATIHLSPGDVAYPGIAAHGPFPTAGGAIMSAPFMVAAILQDGRPSLRHFIDSFGDGPLHHLSRRIAVVADPQALPNQGRLRVRTSDGGLHDVVSQPRALVGLGLEAMRALISPLTAEWIWPDSEARFDRLVGAIAALERDGIAPLVRCVT